MIPAQGDEEVKIQVFDHRIATELLAQVAAVELVAFSPPWGYESLLSTLQQAGSALAVVVEPSAPLAPLAFCLYQQIVDEVSILQIATAPAARRRGYGLRLLQFVQKAALAQGCIQLFLEVRQGNVEALALYQAAGFVQQAVRRNYYADTGEDALLLTCELGLTVSG
jgi:ribosomal-protein-alanine N-acetyltransferase